MEHLNRLYLCSQILTPFYCPPRHLLNLFPCSSCCTPEWLLHTFSEERTNNNNNTITKRLYFPCCELIFPCGRYVKCNTQNLKDLVLYCNVERMCAVWIRHDPPPILHFICFDWMATRMLQWLFDFSLALYIWNV